MQSPKKAKTSAKTVAATPEDLDLDVVVDEMEKAVKKEKPDEDEDLDDSFDESEMERDITEAATAFVDVDEPLDDDDEASPEIQPPPVMIRPSPKKRLNFDDPPPKVREKIAKLGLERVFYF